MHLNIIREDLIVGYTDEDGLRYNKKIKELLKKGYKLEETEYKPSGDIIEYYVKGNKIFSINHLAV
ncbi:hypothetical protein [Paraliobacillus ryukyuensis]|uniref:hypothetical protein n=1 Tax=Paraliobacillus ryukyuensis TaxID=200904 RepID=UPI0009A7D051|nr:hypothetical protein [Paraliobacillus ryukyuensis]